ncbi:MAG: YafY family transcriptional regulator [Chloroflexi bacterium]|nr:YafY family transcriptional regulator [Chloroflexota bacterium]
MYHPTTRVLAVLELLQAQGTLTGAELAERLEVNIRTLRRYITILQDLGIPIIAERGRHGAYSIDPGFKLPPMMFTNDEALALTLGLLAAKSLNLAESAQAAESARAKLERVMPVELKAQVRALAETITLDLNAVSISPASAIILSMSNAAQRRYRVHMHYRSEEDTATERDFDPYGLAYYQDKWYAVGYCHLRRDLRSFRLDRIEQVALSDARFERPETFDALAYVVQALATVPRRFSFQLWLQVDLLTAQSIVPNDLGILEPRDDGVLLNGRTDDLDWLARQIAGFPFAFVVKKPKQLRAALRRRAEELMSCVPN